jgi:hypothetical protein
LTAYSKANGKSYILFTNQHNSWRDTVSLFGVEEGQKAKLLEQGTVPVIRENHPSLRVKQIIYFLLEPDNELVKLIIRGKGLSSMYDFFDEFEANEHIFEYKVRVGVKEEQGDLGTYYYNTFEKVEPVDDIELVQTKIKEVVASIEEIDNYYKKKEEEMKENNRYKIPDAEEFDTPENNDEIPVVDDDDIDVNDIPF